MLQYCCFAVKVLFKVEQKAFKKLKTTWNIEKKTIIDVANSDFAAVENTRNKDKEVQLVLYSPRPSKVSNFYSNLVTKM